MNSGKKRSRVRLWKMPIIKLIFLVLVLFLIWMLFMNSCKLEAYEVNGSTHYTEEQIIDKVVGEANTDNTILIYLKYKLFDRLSLPFIEKFDFNLQGFHKLEITVYEKMVIGCIEFLGEYLYFDKDGIIVETSSELMDNIPFIKGLKFSKVILHDKIETESDEIYQAILDLSQLNEKYQLGIDVMAFNSAKEITIECDNVKILLGKRTSFHDIFGEIKGILKEVEGKNITIDMTQAGEGKGHIYAVPND